MKKLKYVVFCAILVIAACTKDAGNNEKDGASGLNISQVLNSNLVVHWSFDDIIDQQLLDASSNSLNGLVRGAQNVEGVRGRAYSFDGEDDYVDFASSSALASESLSLLGKGSISVWFKADSIPLADGILPIFYYGSSENCLDMPDASNQGLIIEIGHSPLHEESKRLYFTIFANGCKVPSFCVDTQVAIEEDRWYHFVAVVGDSYNTLYLDGKELIDRKYNFGSSLYSQFFEDAVQHENIMIGKGFWNKDEVFFAGQIDELKIFEKDLNYDEVNFLFGGGVVQ